MDLELFGHQEERVGATPASRGPGWWAGAPSAYFDQQSGQVVLAWRERAPRDGSAGQRGYRLVVAVSDDGLTFERVWSAEKSEIGTVSIERPCIRRARNGEWRLYTSWLDPSGERWEIALLRSRRLDGFSVSQHADGRDADGPRVSVLHPDVIGVHSVKDPYVVESPDGKWTMLVSTFLTAEGPAPTYLATSRDGLHFVVNGPALRVSPRPGAWDAYQARLGGVLLTKSGLLGFYDGAGSAGDDTHERTGLCVSTGDLGEWRRLTPAEPALAAAHGRGSLRYVDAIRVGGYVFFYYEREEADGSHVLVVSRGRADTVEAAVRLLPGV
jgi:hypothetical protein